MAADRADKLDKLLVRGGDQADARCQTPRKPHAAVVGFPVSFGEKDLSAAISASITLTPRASRRGLSSLPCGRITAFSNSALS